MRPGRILALAAVFAGCSGAHLYGIGLEDTTADRLGINSNTLRSRMKKLGISRP